LQRLDKIEKVTNDKTKRKSEIKIDDEDEEIIGMKK
jgi:hypothetical protein